MLCGGVVAQKRGPCRGDSGGPLICTGDDSNMLVVRLLLNYCRKTLFVPNQLSSRKTEGEIIYD